ncbi:MAG: zinc ribbon domain-containing protein [bacterium]|nr:zinc ribbon domain-containing protein [bacterium]
MICSKCGAKNDDSSILCAKCGAQLKRSKGWGADRVASKQQVVEHTAISANGGSLIAHKVASNITLCPDGTYRWVYEISRKPSVLIIGGFWGLMSFVLFMLWEFIKEPGQIAHLSREGDLFGVFLALGLLGYIIALSFVKFCLLYEMNDEGITCTKFDHRVNKNEVTKAIASFIDPAAGNFQTAAAEILAYAETDLSSSFSAVQSVEVKHREHAILVKDHPAVNEIHTEKEDFDFVLDFIKNHVSAEVARNT